LKKSRNFGFTIGDRSQGGLGEAGLTWGMVRYVEWAVGIWLALTMSVVLFRILTGRIIVAGMLRDDKDADFEIHRLQLLAVSLMFAAGYVAAALPHGGAAMPNMPDIKPVLLFGLIGSHGAYLAGKTAAARRNHRSKQREGEAI
jgi:hypothetical protein